MAHVPNIYVGNSSTFLGQMLKRKTSEESNVTTAEISMQIDCRKLVDPAAILGLKCRANGWDACLTCQRGTGQPALPASLCLYCYRARLAYPDPSLNLSSPGVTLLIPQLPFHIQSNHLVTEPFSTLYSPDPLPLLSLHVAQLGIMLNLDSPCLWLCSAFYPQQNFSSTISKSRHVLSFFFLFFHSSRK